MVDLAPGTTVRVRTPQPSVTPVHQTRGEKGDTGAPGGSDASFAAFVADPASATRSQLSATIAAEAAPPADQDVTEGEAQRVAANGTTRTVALTGHSLVYGQDTTATGTLPAANGASQTRSSTPPPEQFGAVVGFLSPTAVTVVNQGYPGDRSLDAISRWAGGSSGAVEFFWLDVNDANNFAGYTDPGTLTDDQTRANLQDLIERARGRGASVIVVGGSPDSSETNTRKSYAAAQTERTVAERMGARYIDVGEILTGLVRSKSLFSSAPHLTPEAYTLVGTRLAALMGPKGVNPPKVSPGRVITPRDRLHFGGTPTTRAGAADGTVVRLTTGQAFGLAVDVQEPCVPIIRLRVQGTTIGYGRGGIYYGVGAAGQPTRWFSTTVPTTGTGANGGYVYVRAQPLLSPGPDAVIIRADSGELEVDSVTFVPLPELQAGGQDSFSFARYRPLNLYPVGGPAGRGDTNWDAMLDLTSGATTRRGQAGTSNNTVKWSFELTLGVANSGVILGQSIALQSAAMLEQGYMVLRNGANLILRKLETGTVTDVTVAAVFAATGRVRASIEVVYDGAANLATVYVDGVSQTTFTPAHTFYMAGLIAGAAASGGYAAGQGSVYLKDGDYL